MLVQEPPDRSIRIRGSKEAYPLFAPLLAERVEAAAFAYVGGDHGLLGLRLIRSAHDGHVPLCLRTVVRDVLAFDARRLLMAHNHPAGVSRPSRGDVATTAQFVRTLAPLNVEVVDHLVIAEDGMTSFRVLGLL